MKNLVIVESPAKAKTIGKYLGPDFIVKSSVGHIRDLPSGGSGRRRIAKGKQSAEKSSADPRKKLYQRMGIDPTKGWKADYEVVPGREKVVAELKSLVKKADAVYLATDLDREGESIAWHLRELIGSGDKKSKTIFHRVVFNEITRQAIQEAFRSPSEVDIHRVNAQQARRFLDRIVGFMVSPLLWRKVARGLSAGRVQSVAVRLVVEREREIRAFISEEYWTLHVDAKKVGSEPLRLQVRKCAGKDFRPGSEKVVKEAMAALKGKDISVVKREDKALKIRPNPPFTTSTLQQAASARLSFGVRKTMRMAQILYEAGHITYMRTDSFNLSGSAVAACRNLIKAEYGARYLPKNPQFYKSRKGAQEAHEAIRPTDAGAAPDSLRSMERDAVRLYDLVRRQFIACQMPAAEYAATTLIGASGEFELRVSGRVLRFDGFTKVLPPFGKKGEQDAPSLPELQAGDLLKFLGQEPSQHFTHPPPRYTEASLVREMEKRGIGRPSTYASIISTIQERGYVSRNGRSLRAEKISDIVTDRLLENFSELMDYGFTAEMEESLDKIEKGKLDWKEKLNDFYQDFLLKLELAEGDASAGGMRGNAAALTDISCARCERKMQIRSTASGIFLGCSGYNLEEGEGRCRETLNLVSGEESVAEGKEAEEEEAQAQHQRDLRRCPKCKTAMDVFLVDSSRRLHICGRSPDCDGCEVEQGRFRVKGYEGPEISCDRCGSSMELKSGRFGKYFACTGTDCSNTRKLLSSGQPAPPKMKPVPMPELRCQKTDDYFVLRDGAAGLFLAASGFPRHRETRPVLVEEMLPHRDEIDPKYEYLLDAPKQDPKGRSARVHFSRKEGCQYVASEKENGKASGWRADYKDGRWQESAKGAASSSRGSGKLGKAAKTKTGKPSTKAGKSSTETGKPSTKTGKPSTKAGKPSTKAGKLSTKAGKSSTETGKPSTKAGKSSTETGKPSTKAGKSSTETGKLSTETGKSSTKTGKSSK